MTQKLYLMKNSQGLFKIGVSNNPVRRCASIRNSSGFMVEIIKVWSTVGPAVATERRLHIQFKNQRQYGEWFTDLCIEDIEEAEPTLTEVDRASFIVPKSAKPKLIKVVDLGAFLPRPVCEIILDKRWHDLMESVPRTMAEVKELEIKQRGLLDLILKITDKSKAVQDPVLAHSDDIPHSPNCSWRGRKGWASNLLRTNVVMAPDMTYRTINLQTPASIRWDVVGHNVHSSTVFPFVSTHRGAESISKVLYDSWVEEINSSYERSIRAVIDAFSFT